MKTPIKTLDNQSVGEKDLATEIFGLDVRPDILSRVIEWQLSKRRSGNHQTKGISQISGTTKKPHAQKGTGKARQGSLRSAQMRGGAVIFGPLVRSHAYKLPKKIRVLGLKVALSAKASSGKLILIKDLSGVEKTRDLVSKLENLGLSSALFIDGPIVNESFKRAVSNIPYMDVLPQQGINVYDIMRRDILVLTEAAIHSLEERLK
jgi:large subunit ribosomal protein L4